MPAEMARNAATVLLPSSTELGGLKPATARMLHEALERGQISIGEIAMIMPREMSRDRERSTQFVAEVGKLFRSRGVKIVSDRELAAYRIQYPLKKPSDFKPAREPSARRVSRNTSSDGEFQFNVLRESENGTRFLPLLTPAQEMELGRDLLENRSLRARNKLVEHNLRLAQWVARRYVKSKIPLEDLVQEAYIGLMIAADKWDYRIARFTTYATWWVRQSITRSIMDRSELIRLPVHIQEFRNKILKAAGDAAARLGRPPTIDEVAKEARISKEKIRRTFLQTSSNIVSLDDKVRSSGQGDGNESTIGDLIADIGGVNAEVMLQAKEALEEARERLREVLEDVTVVIRLSERDVQVFNAFYGFDGSGKRRTLEYVGDQFKISRERIRQIISNIWQAVDARGSEMSHEHLLQELVRIDELEKIVNST